eukprot:sb/3465444/
MVIMLTYIVLIPLPTFVATTQSNVTNIVTFLSEISDLLYRGQSEEDEKACHSQADFQLKYHNRNGRWQFQNLTIDRHYLNYTCTMTFDLLAVTKEKMGNIWAKLQSDRTGLIGSIGQDLSMKNTSLACTILLVHDTISCSGKSACHTDECDCRDENVFYCPRGPRGCIPFGQVCDGHADCEGGMDECLCSSDTVQITCLQDKSFSTCLSKKEACSSQEAFRYLQCEGFDPEEANCSSLAEEVVIQPPQNIGLILDEFYQYLNEVSTTASRFNRYPERQECLRILVKEFNQPEEGTKWSKNLCSRIQMTSLNEALVMYLVFQCDDSRFLDQYIEGGERICDGNMDCPNGMDELVCPGRFYCSTTAEDMEWIEEDGVCDGVRDCSNGMDECTGCKL